MWNKLEPAILSEQPGDKLPVLIENPVFNATFNNISAISRHSVLLLMEKSGVPAENHRSATSHWQTLSHNVASSTHRWSLELYDRNTCIGLGLRVSVKFRVAIIKFKISHIARDGFKLTLVVIITGCIALGSSNSNYQLSIPNIIEIRIPKKFSGIKIQTENFFRILISTRLPMAIPCMAALSNHTQ